MSNLNKTSKEVVEKMLRPRRWVSTYDLEWAAGPGATRRLRELRAEGYEIKKRRAVEGQAYEYRLVSRP